MREAQTRRILLVDDEMSLLMTLGDYLRFVGLDVSTAQTAEEALSLLDTVQPDLIVLDVRMPGMGGLAFLRRIEGDDGRPKYPVLLFTATAAMNEIVGRVHVDGFMAKPCAKESLVRMINHILARRNTEQQKSRRAALSLLVAETNAAVTDVVGRLLTDAGYEVDNAAAVTEILEKAAVLAPDAILMNRKLANISGCQLVAMLGAMPSTRSIPVVLYDDRREGDAAAAMAPDDLSRQRRCPAIGEPRELLEAVRSVLRA